jgi:hypothetical protein
MRSPLSFDRLQSASPLSTWKWPAGTVHVGVDLPGRAAQIGDWSAAALALLAPARIAARRAPRPRIAVLLRQPRPLVERRPAIHPET